jgi:nucleoside-diphosphate-sugar epimerase
VKALVTGAGGFLGGHLIEELLARGSRVQALVRPSRKLPESWEERGVERLATDLRRPEDSLEAALADADVVFHLAATTAGTWRSMFDTTVAATQRLLDAMRASGWRGRLVHVSSFSVYGLNQVRARSLVDESTPLEPNPWRRDDYAWTKWLQERLVREFRDEGGVEVAIVRPGVIYGPGRAFQHQLGRELGPNVLLLYGGLVTMRLTYVENVASLLAECGENPRAAGEVFNAVDPRPLRQFQYARRWRGADRGRRRVVPFPLWALRALGAGLARVAEATDGAVSPPSFLDPYRLKPAYGDFRYDTSKATRLLGWRPPVSRERALDLTFAEAGP